MYRLATNGEKADGHQKQISKLWICKYSCHHRHSTVCSYTVPRTYAVRSAIT